MAFSSHSHITAEETETPRSHSLAQDHTHIPFRASQDLTPRPSGLRACALGAQGDEGWAVTVPASTEGGRGTDRLHPPSPDPAAAAWAPPHPLDDRSLSKAPTPIPCTSQASVLPPGALCLARALRGAGLKVSFIKTVMKKSNIR